MEATVRSGNGRVMMRAKPSRREISQEKRDAFLGFLIESCNVTWSARQAGLCKASVYKLRRRDAAFAAAWQDAIETGYVRLEMGLVEAALALVEGKAETEDGDAAPRVIEALSMEQAIQLLERYRATVKAGRAQSVRPGAKRMPTAEETDAAILERLEILRRQRGWNGQGR
ncbi:MAG TPA: hypothetical protein PKD99_06490 [Sphingopyxis sp.]|nr:hypothetical protein [Sphingopyxis sp.]HMP44737.1 hypothetical protein [Sphingopyxis sp.]HMQ18631.1 hypothetical protein [Sphingopyxis sp.]